ncbi:MAG: hypothetical protein VYE22_22595 [Myxococcota bacterium]|nr:hypothetical protein [Myxococcota bacterium]
MRLLLLASLALVGCYESHAAAPAPDAGPVVCDHDRYWGPRLPETSHWYSLYEGCDGAPIVIFAPEREPLDPEALEGFRERLAAFDDVTPTSGPCCPSRPDSPRCVVWPVGTDREREAFERGDYDAWLIDMWLIGAGGESPGCAPIRRPLR